MKLTLQQLKAAGACREQVVLFRRYFGLGGAVTLKRCLDHASEFDWNWAANNLLSPTQRAEYERIEASALAEYRRIEAPALAEYERVQAPAWAEYWRIEALAWAEYARVRASALAEYQRIEAPALAEYKRAKAQAFFTASQVKG